MADVKLHGFWCSPFSLRVIWALKLKGVDYDYIEEDLSNKSELLLKYNPVHKKIPVLVHLGKPMAESMVILEYIEETWPENPLLPSDAYERARARFWMKYLTDKSSCFTKFLGGIGEEQEKAAEVALELLKTIEEEALGDKKFFGGDEINLVDISFGVLAYWCDVMEEVVGIQLLEQRNLPRLHAWAVRYKEVAVVKESLPDHKRMVSYMRALREKIVAENRKQ